MEFICERLLQHEEPASKSVGFAKVFQQIKDLPLTIFVSTQVTTKYLIGVKGSNLSQLERAV